MIAEYIYHDKKIPEVLITLPYEGKPDKYNEPGKFECINYYPGIDIDTCIQAIEEDFRL